MNLQILSAGLGTRLRPLTDKIPKPVVPVLNVPMFFYSYHYFRNETFKNKVVNTFHLEEILKAKIQNYSKNFQFISDGKEVLGTGGGIANAKKLLAGENNFWVINGDGVFISDEDFIGEAQRVHHESNAICTLVVMDHKDVGTKFGGVWVNNLDEVLDIGKTRPAKAMHGYHFTGFRILNDKVFEYLKNEPSELFDALRAAMKDGHKVAIYKTNGEFFETGNLEDYLSTTKTLLKYLKQNKYRFLKSLLKKYSPDSTLDDLNTEMKMEDHSHLESLLLDKNFKLFHDCELEGFVVAGKNVEVKENSHLKNVVILNDQKISKNSEFENTIIY